MAKHNLKEIDFFSNPKTTVQKRYEALRMFFLENKTAEEVAKKYGYKITTVYTLTKNFKRDLIEKKAQEKIFVREGPGWTKKTNDSLRKKIIEFRKQNLSVPDIKAYLDGLNEKISERQIYNILREEGFSRLPRRSNNIKSKVKAEIKIPAKKTTLLNQNQEKFNSEESLGIICLLPYIKKYGIDKLINKSTYPETKATPKLNSILSFLALKLCNHKRYSHDDAWCADRGLGLFAGLNVLPKSAWFTSYSHRVTREMNISFLQELAKLWTDNNLISDTANLDFCAIPYWGNDSHLENNWSGTRHRALSSILAAIAHDPETGIMTYGNTNIRHKNESGVIVEFLDFYKKTGRNDIKFLVFDSKFTTYENLRKLDENETKFITIRRRGKSIVDKLESTDDSEWKKIRIKRSDGKTKQLRIKDENIALKGYGKKIRQIAITGHGKIKPALIITNDFDLPAKTIVQKYAKRWLVEKNISEQTHFFHLNKVSSSMVIKVDFDLTMTILAHNLYRIMALDLPGYEHNTASTLYNKFIRNSGFVEIDATTITVKLKKKRNLPLLLSAMNENKKMKINFLADRELIFEGSSTS